MEILDAARAELQRSGDEVASALRGEAALAPRDSQKQADADFYGGILDSISAAAQGAWTLVSDPAVAAGGAVQAAAHPVDTAKGAIAYDAWAGGREPRALGRNTGDLILGAATLGAGKIASILGRETRVAGESGADNPANPPSGGGVALHDSGLPQQRHAAVRGIVLGTDGRPHGVEDATGVYLIDSMSLAEMRKARRADLGAPDIEATDARGDRETWIIDAATRRR